MFTSQTTVRRHGTPARRSRWLAAPACALALLMLAGNAAAVPLVRDDARSTRLVEPGPDPVLASNWLLPFKLATPAGYSVLVFG